MTTPTDTIDFHDDSLSQEERTRALTQLTRDVAVHLLNRGAEPQEISYMFAHIAAELGLHFTDSSYMVFPTVLVGLRVAAISAYKWQQGEALWLTESGV